MSNFKDKVSEEAKRHRIELHGKESTDESLSCENNFEFGAQWASDEILKMLRSEQLNGGEWWSVNSHYGRDYADYLEKQIRGENE